jgi:xanthine/uracil permease
MKFKYSINDVPPLNILILNGLQWFVLLIPIIIMVGKTIGVNFLLDPHEETLYIQKLLFIVSLSLFLQMLFGHGLPVISGPATVILVGLVASKSYSLSSLYSALLIGSLFICVLGCLNVTKKLIAVFTKNIISVVLILIAFTMLPALLKLILDPIGIPVGYNLIIALIILLLLFFLEKILKGFWKTSLILLTMLVGTILYLLIFGEEVNTNGLEGVSVISNYFSDFIPIFEIDIGLILTFIICYIALVINDIGSMQSVSAFIGITDNWYRIKRGVLITGITNFLASLMCCIGVVNFSFSPGVLVITKCASKYVLLFTALLLLILSFSPYFIDFINIIPHLLIGAIFLYVMASQISTGLSMLYSNGQFEYNDGIVVGFSVMLGATIANLPPETTLSLPDLLRPFLGNGFVMGLLFAFILEHIVYRKNNLDFKKYKN